MLVLCQYCVGIMAENTRIENVSDVHFSNNQDGGDQNKDIPLVFFQEASLFKPGNTNNQNYIKHEEMYIALSSLIDCTHITGLQRINGMWRIYVDNLSDKATLISSGVTLRGKTLPLLNTNPLRFDNHPCAYSKYSLIG